MSSFAKAIKTNQRTHRERVNVLSKGFLERKKDYQTRAREYNRRKEIFTKLRKKALDKNPDEFFFRMKSSQLIDGIHYDKRKDDDEYTPEELQLMQSQDINYVNFKRSIDLKKIPKLQSELHYLDEDPNKPRNTHTFFVENHQEKANVFNKIKNTLTKSSVGKEMCENEELASLNEIKEMKYRRLYNKINREQFLKSLTLKMQIKRQLLNPKEQAKKISKGNNKKPPVYQWKMQRKR